MDAPAPKRTVHPLIKIWVVFHGAMIFLWSVPHPNAAAREQFQRQTPVEKLVNLKDTLMVLNDGVIKGDLVPNDPIPYYMNSTGLWQWWDMFAPNPADTDAYMDAEVEYADGTVALQKYPRMFDLPIGQKYLKERYRKYRERLTNDTDSWKWNVTAQRLALENYRATGKVPVVVRLWRHWQVVAPLGQPQPTKYEQYMFWEYEVDQIKLAEDFK